MAQFLKFLLASCLGTLLAGFALFGIGSLIVVSIASQSEQVKSVSPNSVLYLTFKEPVPEKTDNLEMANFSLRTQKVLGLREITQTLEKAKEDDNIKGVLLELDELTANGIVTTSALRQALLEFRESGKFVIAYGKYYSQGAYYLASVADEIYLNPLGLIDFRGFGAQIPFFKKMLDKLGVEMQIFYAGQFKSATEPYRLTRMSEQNRLQTREFLSTIYRDFLRDVAASRKVSVEELDQVAGDYKAGTAEGALKAKLVDVVGYRDEALQAVRERLGLKEDEDIPSISLRDYNLANPPATNYSASSKIAVVYAEGSIIDGEGENGIIGDARYVRDLRKVRLDDQVKAIVLRVNSPGGSAMASENIWRELMLAKKEGKPVIVSMGDYAASGGYYIAAAADSIFAEEKTLTGSIGVFSIVPNLGKFLDEKAGITFDTVKTTDHGVGLGLFMPLTEEEKRFMQQRTEAMYEVFLKRVSEGRNMSRDSVHAIAQGRVWTGLRAREIGLVDRLGDLETAIASAAKMANLSDYRLTEYPRIKDPYQQLLEELMGQGDDDKIQSHLIRQKAPQIYPYLRFLEDLQTTKGVQARLPMVFQFN